MDFDAGLFVRRDASLASPDLMFHFGTVPWTLNTGRVGYRAPEHGISMTPNIPKPHTSGRLYLTSPDPDVISDDDLSAFARSVAHTVYHPSGTCRMGSLSDPLVVVDPALRVRDVTNLRIADGSIFPSMPTVNPVITTMMVGERAADLLKEPTR
jgi:choline dehydrogenase-like flavoprotein